MIGVVMIIVVAVALGVVLWWTTRLEPTRPRPGSRHRGPTYMSVHRRLQRRRRG